MNENIVKKLRSGITGSLVLSAIVALLGAIAIFVTTGILNDSYLSSSDQLPATIVLLVAWDLLRMGGFGMFVCSLISVIFELFGKASGKLYSFVMLGGSIFGLISGFMLSISSILKTAMGAVVSAYSSHGGSSSTSGDSSGIFTVACVFGIISSVIVFVGLGMRGVQPQPLAYPQGYPQQYPPQGYPQQYPQQGYPQYPQPGVPVQPQQSEPVQPPIDLNKQ